MLKIKDKIPLNELEKFGFVRKYDNVYIKDIDPLSMCIVDIEDRIISVGSDHILYNLNIIFDLIQASLVEKMEE